MRLTVVALDQHYTKRYTLGRNNSHFNMKDSQATDTDQFNTAGVNGSCLLALAAVCDDAQDVVASCLAGRRPTTDAVTVVLSSFQRSV